MKLTPAQTIQQLFGEYVSRHEANLIKRCAELGWPAGAWEAIKKRGWVKPLPDSAKSWERQSLTFLNSQS